MAKQRYKISAGCVYNINYDIVWCPKYRKPVLIDDVAKDLDILLKQKASQVDMKIEALEIMPDHVHLFVSSIPTLPIHYIVQQLKGFASHELRGKYEHLRKKLPTLWSRSYYAGTIGSVSDTVVKNYIANQKGK
jgi:putative transposase